jgi:hypothetical protein
MTKNEQLRRPASITASQPHQPPEHLNQAQIQQPKHHAPIVPDFQEKPAHMQRDKFWHGTGDDG